MTARSGGVGLPIGGMGFPLPPGMLEAMMKRAWSRKPEQLQRVADARSGRQFPKREKKPLMGYKQGFGDLLTRVLSNPALQQQFFSQMQPQDSGLFNSIVARGAPREPRQMPLGLIGRK